MDPQSNQMLSTPPPVFPAATEPSTEKSASAASSSGGSRKKLVAGFFVVFFLAASIGIGSYFLKSRQASVTNAGPTDISQCSDQRGIIRVSQCNPGEALIGVISGGDGQQLCCKPPTQTKPCPGRCVPASEAGACDPSTIIRDLCSNSDELCCSPIVVLTEPPVIPVTSPPPPPPPLTSPPPAITSPVPNQCPDPQKLKVKVECIGCAD